MGAVDPVALVEGPVAVSVPATSANLGPGYDSLGLALALRDELTAEVAGEALEVDVIGEGADGVPRDATHLVVRSLHLGLRAMGASVPAGLRIGCVNALPHSRGLGSSSAAIVGGLGLARGLVHDGARRLDDVALFELASRIEGHPDNVAPACFGGLTVAGVEGERFFAVPAPLDPDLSAVVFVPDEPVATAVARGLLPDSVPHADAAANASRAALLTVALGGRPELLHAATRDYLHQSYRAPAMPRSAALVDELRADGVPAVISGAGPTVLALLVRGQVPRTGSEAHTAAEATAETLMARCPRGWRALHLAVDARGVVVR